MKSKNEEQTSSLPVATIASLVVAVIVVAGLVWYFFRASEPPPADEAVGRPVAERFLAELQAKRAGSAWDLTTAEFKSDEGRESFIRWAAQRPVLTSPLEFQEYRLTDFNGLKRAECVYRPPAGSKINTQVRIAVGQEFGEWKVERVDAD